MVLPTIATRYTWSKGSEGGASGCAILWVAVHSPEAARYLARPLARMALKGGGKPGGRSDLTVVCVLVVAWLEPALPLR
jgi:hypothetical protein